MGVSKKFGVVNINHVFEISKPDVSDMSLISMKLQYISYNTAFTLHLILTSLFKNGRYPNLESKGSHFLILI